METKEYRTVDKSEWPRGVWDAEPDKMQWPDPATGLPCLVVRGPSGALCGYVGVPAGHPLFGKDNDGDACDYIRVHGGLTFSGPCADAGDEARHICHVPGPGEPDHVWWLGFDCAHCDDLSPARFDSRWARLSEETYKNIAYVRAEVARLAAQLKAAA